MILSDEQQKQIEKKIHIRNCPMCMGHLKFDANTITHKSMTNDNYNKELLVITCANCGYVQLRDIKYILPDWK